MLPHDAQTFSPHWQIPDVTIAIILSVLWRMDLYYTGHREEALQEGWAINRSPRIIGSYFSWKKYAIGDCSMDVESDALCCSASRRGQKLWISKHLKEGNHVLRTYVYLCHPWINIANYSRLIIFHPPTELHDRLATGSILPTRYTRSSTLFLQTGDMGFSPY
jgi:hypothetical protein